LIPKETDVVTIQKFIPIALTNCSFKIFSKCAINSLGLVSEKLISPNQTAFIKQRYILESVVSAHEVIHDAAHKGHSGFIFKLDYEKSYGRVDRDFLLTVMKMRGFIPKWMPIIEGLLHNGFVGVRINDCNSHFFLTSRGVRQGDPISPILFNFMADVFTKILYKAACGGQIAGLMQDLGRGESLACSMLMIPYSSLKIG
jgi:hypothetical protein